MVKNMLVVGLFVCCLVLIFRIYDLGVTLTYLKDDLTQAQNNLHTISEFQRNNCSLAYGKIDGVNIFRKANKIVINTLEFECKPLENGSEGLLYFVEK
ncbi:MAG: hypothetical protein IPJ99_01525 [Betaproteobacteria bacterium]|nr:hypothetical protein [Betaproteobacteria bacterium]MBK7898063.1 hypothetical protein [Betaproteobacteria bacterium]